ncbi:hypothetical protein U8527_05585 [Kordia algicida OT-1]|uniref:DUF2262 domain-containing protein n=1 Tax=Kordia algicida OT-1 TaxID=391587 RepID=A9DMV5_9FLAO|nr:hypothetical protein [Kordia algicida]EDP97797.1 hypothetical protein KAOT1_21582 [Kordia algicida OT-1]
MEEKTNFDEIKIVFKGTPTTIDLSDAFYKLNNTIRIKSIKSKGYENFGVSELNLTTYNDLKEHIKRAIQITEEKIDDFYEEDKEELEPLYSAELDHFRVEFDLMSYGLNKENHTQPKATFDILIDCMDYGDQPIFLYDSRGLFYVSFELTSNNELNIIEIS